MKAMEMHFADQFKKFRSTKVDMYIQCIRQIFEKRFSITDLYLITGDLSADISLGQQYSVIRDQLQTVCKIHRKFVAESAQILCSDNSGYVTVAPDLKAQAQYTEQKLNQIKLKQSVIWVLYHHYRSLAESNRQICIFWEILNTRKPQRKAEKYFELKENVLNHLAIKELVPSSEHINLRPLETSLTQLIEAPSVLKKDHLREMYTLFIQSEMRSTLYKNKQLCRKQVSKVTMKFEGDGWLEQAKADSIGSKFSQLLQDRYNLLYKQEGGISQPAYQEIRRQIIPKTLIDFGIDDNQIRLKYKQTIITTTQIIEEDDGQQIIKPVMRTKVSKQTEQNNDDEAKEKKKKKRKRNKKKKNKIEDRLAKQEPNKNQEVVHQREANQFDRYIQETIKLLTSTVIDNSAQIDGIVPKRTVEQWRQWAQSNDPI